MLDLKVLNATLDQIEEEKRIPRAQIIEAIEQALAAAYKKDFGKKGQIIRAKFDKETGSVDFFQVKIVADETTTRPEVEEGSEEDMEVEEEGEENPLPRFDPAKHILLKDARMMKSGAKLDDEIIFPLESNDDFGRIAAQTAKQVIIQRLREAVKTSLLDEYSEMKGQIVTGIVQKVERGTLLVDLGRTVAIMPKEEQIPGEYYKTGQRIKALLYHIEETPRGLEIRLSRSHPQLIESLFMLESPEVASGVVVIKAIAREAGTRSKIAVVSYDENIDPIGACVGQKGIRAATVTSELGGEKIDIIAWSEDNEEFVAASLSPAHVVSIDLNEEQHIAYIEVADNQLSLAIGKGGLNVRLAAKLTGWKIDIKGVEGEVTEDEDIEEKINDEIQHDELSKLLKDASAMDKDDDEESVPVTDMPADEDYGDLEGTDK